ncbi:MAG: hypothetical protein AVO35_11995 [Candidatus Aegiribacteria sp. MLS_C]|nr:MAG: hypothetical protein AVO35_11995 [Candidatus Aegiribacteria sp. MLS_C]
MGIILMIAGVITVAVGIWRNRNPGGPILVGDVTDYVRDLYGVRRASRKPLVIGSVLFLTGLVLLLAR